jgi:hypothetical protein
MMIPSICNRIPQYRWTCLIKMCFSYTGFVLQKLVIPLIPSKNSRIHHNCETERVAALSVAMDKWMGSIKIENWSILQNLYHLKDM